MPIARDTPIVILTGAGISKESGLDTFRDADGIWTKVRLEDVATPEGFARDPRGVHAFYNARRRQLTASNIQPNAAHRALARLEDAWSAPVTVVTQNIDDLHERAGSRDLIHMHGELLSALCALCAARRACRDDLALETACPACGGTGGMRPDVVWFGEMPYHMERIDALLGACGLFISIGTSGNVYPAAGFVELVRRQGAGETVELNLEPSAGQSMFADTRYGAATEIVPAYVDELIAGI